MAHIFGEVKKRVHTEVKLLSLNVIFLKNIQNAHCCEIMILGVALSFQFVAVLCCFSQCFKLGGSCHLHLTFTGNSDNMLKACHTSVAMFSHTNISSALALTSAAANSGGTTKIACSASVRSAQTGES